MLSITYMANKIRIKVTKKKYKKESVNVWRIRRLKYI